MSGAKGMDINMKKSNFQKNYSYAICIVVLFFLEIYLMVNYPNLWIGIIADAILIVLFTCLTISFNVALMKEKEEKKEVWQEEIQNINKSEKANYLLLKKSFLDLEDRFIKQEKMNLSITNAIDVSERKLQKAIMQIMEEDKKVARISVGRSKENADSMINSNNEVKRKMNELENRLNEINDKMNSLEDLISSSMKQELETNPYQEIIVSIDHMKEKLKTYIESTIQKAGQAERKLESDTINNSHDNERIESFDIDQEHDFGTNESLLEKSVIDSEDVFEEKLLNDSDAMEEEIVEAPESGFDGEMDSMDSEKIITDEELPSYKDTNPDEIVPEEMNNREEDYQEENPNVDSELENNLDSEEIITPEEIDDPNKMMTPDDIAALLAGIGSNETNSQSDSDSISETVPEPEIAMEEPIEKPVEVEASDPNKMMTPDEIAALIAGL